jgi:hypothetical protein
MIFVRQLMALAVVLEDEKHDYIIPQDLVVFQMI